MLRKILIIATVAVMMTVMITSWSKNYTSASTSFIAAEPIKVDVLLYTFDDPFAFSIKESLEGIQKQNEGKVEFTFFDAKRDQTIQNQTLDTLLEEKKDDLILLYLVNQEVTKDAVNKIKENNIPVVFLGGAEMEPIRSYSKAYFVGTDLEQDGVLEGKILVNAWNSNKDNIDKNKDNVMQYVMLKGISNNMYAIARTKYSVSTINNAGIKTQELALKVCNWSEEEAKNAIKILFLQFGDKIEAIIANNDAMAVGAIKALQEYGYNNGDKTKTISVVGVDAIPEARELIKKGVMTGTVTQNPYEIAEALYSVGMNLVYNRNPIEGTTYVIDDTGVFIHVVPYHQDIIT